MFWTCAGHAWDVLGICVWPKILIFEKKPVAVYLDGKNRFYISEKGTLIKFIELEDFKDLPMVFGKKINFKKIFIELKKVNFPINEIKIWQIYPGF